MIRILLVDDHLSIRQALAFLMGLEPDMEVVAQAGSLAEARQILTGFDVAIVDLRLPDGDGLVLVKEIRAVNRQAAVLVLTAEHDRRRVAAAVMAGATGVLSKSEELVTVIAAVRRVAAGEALFAPPEMVALMQLAEHTRSARDDAEKRWNSLTPRERETLIGLTHGYSNAELAARMGVGLETARSHVAKVIEKLGVETRLQALAYAIRHGLVSPDDVLPSN